MVVSTLVIRALSIGIDPCRCYLTYKKYIAPTKNVATDVSPSHSSSVAMYSVSMQTHTVFVQNTRQRFGHAEDMNAVVAMCSRPSECHDDDVGDDDRKASDNGHCGMKVVIFAFVWVQDARY